jgi:AcrR family transcriptional regulator
MLASGKRSDGERVRDFERTRAALLAAARRLFAEKGYAACGTPELAQAAGLTRGALYHHFADKQALFRAVVEDVERDILAAIDARAEAAADPWAGLLAGCFAFLDVCARPDVRRILLLDAPAVLGWREWRAIDASYGVGSLAEGIRAAQAAGQLADLPVRALTHLISGALNEAVFLIAEADDPAAVRAEIDQTIEQMLLALCARGS